MTNNTDHDIDDTARRLFQAGAPESRGGILPLVSTWPTYYAGEFLGFIRDVVAESLVYEVSHDGSWSEDQVHTLLDEAVDGALLYTTDIVRYWTNAGMPDTPEPADSITDAMVRALREHAYDSGLLGDFTRALGEWADVADAYEALCEDAGKRPYGDE